MSAEACLIPKSCILTGLCGIVVIWYRNKNLGTPNFALPHKWMYMIRADELDFLSLTVCYFYHCSCRGFLTPGFICETRNMLEVTAITRGLRELCGRTIHSKRRGVIRRLEIG